MHSQPDSAYRQRERSTQGPTGVQREGTADARPYSNVSRTWQDPEINSIEDGRLMKPCELHLGCMDPEEDAQRSTNSSSSSPHVARVCSRVREEKEARRNKKGRREKARRKSAASLIRPTEARQGTNSLQTPFRLQSSRLSLLPNTAKPSETPCECAYPVLRISVGIIAEDNEGLRPALLGASELVILGRGASL
ncbi:hypothetical protein H109_06345 [Trichophyton interdigitale MR816]|uniref:Uncharacterized protein n=1 Tax=Trichophyton interdigitale (strain MR816) TaxID=1215338 RepID=A0A059J2Q2_TRIIM|nr:hypothetical protein H109_06345 [Trichophyton interdigitale MR816]